MTLFDGGRTNFIMTNKLTSDTPNRRCRLSLTGSIIKLSFLSRKLESSYDGIGLRGYQSTKLNRLFRAQTNWILVCLKLVSPIFLLPKFKSQRPYGIFGLGGN